MDPLFSNELVFDEYPAPPPSVMAPPAAVSGPHGDSAGKMFIGGLSWETTVEALQQYFSRFGNIIDSIVMKDPVTQRSRGFGFITFADPESCNLVMKSCPHTLDSRTIDPKPAVPRGGDGGAPRGAAVYGAGAVAIPTTAGYAGYGAPPGAYGGGGGNPGRAPPAGVQRTKKIFVGGLLPETTDALLREFFGQYGQVEEVILMSDRETNRPRGFGFVSFTSEDAVDKLVDLHFVDINGKQVEIKAAQPKNASGMGPDARRGGFGGGPAYGGGMPGGYGGMPGGYGGGRGGGASGYSRGGGRGGAQFDQSFRGGHYGGAARGSGGYGEVPPYGGSTYGAPYGVPYGGRGGYGAPADFYGAYGGGGPAAPRGPSDAAPAGYENYSASYTRGAAPHGPYAGASFGSAPPYGAGAYGYAGAGAGNEYGATDAAYGFGAAGYDASQAPGFGDSSAYNSY